jgi:two-component system OmpR family response regulator
MTKNPLKRILCVEDEPDIQTVTRIALQDVGGFEVQVCGSGQEALAQAPEFEPDLILLDVMMPEMDGPTTLKALRSHLDTAAIPVIFLTAKVQPQEVAQFKALGALDVIAKPFDPITLPDTVRGIWNERHVG